MPNETLRIIGGKLRSRQISFVNESGLRPTPNRIRETLFNWLRDVIINARCLDLFAGSGALGFEALSRGALSVIFVDNNRKVINKIQENAKVLGVDNGCEFIQQDALTCLNGLDSRLRGNDDVGHGNDDTTPSFPRRRESSPFDIVFLDPPFYKNLISEILPLLAEKNITKYIYLEHERKAIFQLPVNLKIIKEKIAGDVAYKLLLFCDADNII